ncbi:hypothetical protein LTR28_014101, partial [Elasticomyces elasticus]
MATLATTHMQLTYPPPFNASNNPHTTGIPDPYLQYPYDCCGPNDRWTYPCRGYLSLLGTPAGAPVASWAAGSTQTWNMSGIGNHYGGSCQVGFSIDGGKSFQVATSYEGNCPHRNGGNDAADQNFEVRIPPDIPAGEAVFAWVWYNREQEFNMNCAAVNITAAAQSYTSSPPSSSYAPVAGSTSTSAPSSDPTTYTTTNGCSCTCPHTDSTSCTCTCPGSARRSFLSRRHLLSHINRSLSPHGPAHPHTHPLARANSADGEGPQGVFPR